MASVSKRGTSEALEKQAAKRAKQALESEMQERETDPVRLENRRKAIAKGKNTLGYTNYIAAVPKARRKREHMRTPDPEAKVSKRRFDGQIRAWRRFLHKYDAPEADGTEDFTADVAAQAEGASTEAQAKDSAGQAAAADAKSAETEAEAAGAAPDPTAQLVKDILVSDDDFDKMMGFL